MYYNLNELMELLGPDSINPKVPEHQEIEDKNLRIKTIFFLRITNEWPENINCLDEARWTLKNRTQGFKLGESYER